MSIYVHIRHKIHYAKNLFYYPFQLSLPIKLYSKEIKISHQLHNNIYSFINNENMYNKYQCHDFVYYVKYKKELDCDFYNLSYKSIDNDHDSEDHVVLFDKYNEIIHSAIYLGDNLYISKYGNLLVGIASKEMLKETYNSNLNK
jgi:hypothetical protein